MRFVVILHWRPPVCSYIRRPNPVPAGLVFLQGRCSPWLVIDRCVGRGMTPGEGPSVSRQNSSAGSPEGVFRRKGFVLLPAERSLTALVLAARLMGMLLMFVAPAVFRLPASCPSPSLVPVPSPQGSRCRAAVAFQGAAVSRGRREKG